ncbi:SGNH/GDSL hydrolase family protein [Caenimonas koreensis]|uniref:GDSL family lipase n=1 Tax=Caenimonas koreensis DSM 17982 TaxID=1121255 RepID=A0A844BB82_9BURK|nr:SGNH/GDSL hydrolase family protein [Caenimonas koreensis]MRD48707.1 GDSL family lipase [Caenimonas koreensis DSM 17982]
MSYQWMRRALVALASVSLLALAGCGSSTTVSQFKPTRAIGFGDAMTDQNQSSARYTVNDTSLNNWANSLSFAYGLASNPVSAGGTFYAAGNARITLHPDAAGNAATPTITEQITSFMATSSFTQNDLIIVQGGYSDIIAQVAAFNAGTQTRDQTMANIGQAARDLGAQVRRIVTAGGSHVAMLGVYDLGRSPWSTATNQAALLGEASQRFNDELLVSVVDLGNSVLYIDTAFLFNLMTSSPASYGFIDAITPICTSVDPGPGIGIGAGQVNSKLCTPTTIGTLATGATYDSYIFADKVYFTPAAHRKLGDYAYSRMTSRF